MKQELKKEIAEWYIENHNTWCIQTACRDYFAQKYNIKICDDAGEYTKEGRRLVDFISRLENKRVQIDTMPRDYTPLLYVE